MDLKVNAVGSPKGIRYYIEYPEGRLHIMNQKSLVWHMKKKMGMDQFQVRDALILLDNNGCVVLRIAA